MTEHQSKVRQLKARMLEVAYGSQQGFLPSSFSILDILVSLYYEVMEYDVQQREYIDNFILSKGHAALALYSVLEDKKIIKGNKLDEWGKFGSSLPLMADRKVPGVLFSTGSLGHGMPEAVGAAYAKKIKSMPGKVFVLVGDGEMNEGTNWEAIQAASRMKLDNLVCIVDCNCSSLFEEDHKGLGEKFAAFDCMIEEVNGHDEQKLCNILQKKTNAVVVILANTVKGKGCSVMEDNPTLWHSKAPNELEFKAMLKEVLRSG